MKEIPLKAVERQNFTIELEGSLFDITLKECNGIMAATIIRDGIKLVENRRICAGMTLIPEGHLEEGNFAFVTDDDNMPYYTRFGSSDVLLYASIEEVEAVRAERNNTIIGPAPGSIPSSPLVDFNYQTGKLADGMTFMRAGSAYLVDGFTLKTFASGVPRFNSNGMLIEPGSTNSIADCRKFNYDTKVSEIRLGDFSKYTTLHNTDVSYGVTTDSISVNANEDWHFSLYIEDASNTTLTLRLLGTAIDKTVSIPSGTRGRVSVHGTTTASGDLRGIVYIGDPGSTPPVGSYMTIGLAQLEHNSYDSTIVYTTSGSKSRNSESIDLTQAGAKTVYREYIPITSTNLVKELVAYNGTYCPFGYLQKLKVWNRSLTDAEAKALGVPNV